MRRRRGSIILDSLIGVLVLGIGAVSFFAIYPVFHRAELRAKQETRAVQMGTRLVEHIQLLTPANLTGQTLSDLNLIDPGQTTSLPPYSFSRIPLDEGTYHSPSRALPSGEGTMNIEDLDSGSKRVTVTIRWQHAGAWRTVKTGTIVGGYR